MNTVSKETKMSSKISKGYQNVFFEISSDVHIQTLGSKTMTLNTLYLNNIVFIREFNQTRDEKFIKTFIDKKEKGELKNSKDKDEFNKLFAMYDINTNESNIVLSHFVIVA